MNLEDKFDRLLQVLEDKARSLIDGGFDEIWFNWLAWAMIAGAIFGIARKDNSTVLYVVSAFSAYLLFFKGWFVAENYIRERLPNVERPSFALFVLLAIAGLMPVTLMYLIGGIFAGLMS